MFKLPLKIIRQILSFSRSDRNALLILGSLILIVLITKIVVINIEREPTLNLSDYRDIIDEWESVNSKRKEQALRLFKFNPNLISEDKLDSLLLPSQIKKNFIKYRNTGAKFNNFEDVKKIYGMNDSIFEAIKNYIEIEVKDVKPKLIMPNTGKNKKKKSVKYFDPNAVEFDELIDLGLNNYQANNLLKYRSNGGKFVNPDDVLKIYGIDSSLYLSIQKQIQIETPTNKRTILEKPHSHVEQIELNSADSLKLVKLVGIGPVFASRIIKYRNLLGGFYKKEQLMEVYNFQEETFMQIKHLVVVDTNLINKQRINFVDFSELISHPYVDKSLANSIISYRNTYGVIICFDQISSISSIDSMKLSRIKPYITCR